jgi:hypothetical protein
MREETDAWLSRVALGKAAPATTAAEATTG